MQRHLGNHMLLMESPASYGWDNNNMNEGQVVLPKPHTALLRVSFGFYANDKGEPGNAEERSGKLLVNLSQIVNY